ncbi:alpha-amylase family glycosyl hydrolase [Hyphococcus lacteus]|uniref:Alpha-amylase family glycosyl hydrolase n=1 Tax=Hyphococcus lacteus TaxID=3143536 RepID=A0ABV3Z397_9PROT
MADNGKKSLGGHWPTGAVIYQIYPRSFMDANNDGIGDIRGILSKLDYIEKLGVDGVWLSPFFTSPMKDFGYDVADYCDVDPIFGTLEDFDELLFRSHARGLRVIIDQVYSHTSDQHPWFEESRQDQNNPKADWYVWADPKPDGSPPNNWQSVFTGSSWEWDARRQQYYLHNFLRCQPDLNLHNKSVRDALIDVARFWLDRGVDGFRLDAINFAMHDPKLRDNPPSNASHPTRPFDFQNHLYNQSHPDIPIFLRELRSVIDEYSGIFTVAEVVGPDPLGEMKAFTAGNRHLTTAYNFDFLYADNINRETIKNSLDGWNGSDDSAMPSWAFSNHDTPRVLSRWSKQKDSNSAKLYLMILLCLRGNIFLYQGEELGLPQAGVPFKDLQDPEAIANWPHTLGRDGARTPMPWLKNAKHAGFSEKKPWLPIDQDHERLSAEQQDTDDSSTLNFTRRILALRRQTPVLREGRIRFCDAPDGLVVFERSINSDHLICVFNLSNKPVEWSPDGIQEILLSTALPIEHTKGNNTIPPLCGYIARK